MSPDPVHNLDDIDRRLIEELFVDGRASYAALAPKVGLSEGAVRARVRRLIDQHVVAISAWVDPHSVGFGMFSFLLMTTAGPARPVGESIAAIDEVVYLVGLGGRWSLFAAIRCRDDRHFLSVLDRIRATDGVAEVESLRGIDYPKLSSSGIASEVFNHPVPHRTPVAAPASRPLDDIDLMLIQALVADGRATFAELAPKVGLSTAGVRGRVQRLFDSEIVVVQAVAGASVLGVASFAELFITVRGPAHAVAEHLCPLPEFTVVAVVGGRFDLTCEVWARDDEHLFSLLERVRSIDSVSSVQAAIHLEIIKEEYRLA
jgi:Lrp/AsnC family transcriptional regulator for asnA, asnC and gidA